MLTLNTVMLLNQPFISAASGLVKIDQRIYVIADDENFLGLYDLNTQSGKSCVLFNGVLPENKKERKKVKKDFESMLYLPGMQNILIVPSGSTKNRERGALVNLDGELLQEVSFSFFYQVLQPHFPELNIEGAVMEQDHLVLLQRGNGELGQNALVKIPWEDFLKNDFSQIRIIPVELDSVGDVKLTFTDATNFGKNFLYLAVAEDSQSVYLDGKVSGAVVGILSSSGVVLAQAGLATTSKPEGLSFCEKDFSLYLVTDDDDRLRPAQLLLGELPLEWKSFLL